MAWLLCITNRLELKILVDKTLVNWLWTAKSAKVFCHTVYLYTVTLIVKFGQSQYPITITSWIVTKSWLPISVSWANVCYNCYSQEMVYNVLLPCALISVYFTAAREWNSRPPEIFKFLLRHEYTFFSLLLKSMLLHETSFSNNQSYITVLHYTAILVYTEINHAIWHCPIV